MNTRWAQRGKGLAKQRRLRYAAVSIRIGRVQQHLPGTGSWRNAMYHITGSMLHELCVLDELAQSIGRQHHISLQINEELDVHHGLLGSMDEEVDRTGNRLSQARRKLDRVARGAKENSTCLPLRSKPCLLTNLVQVLLS